MDELTEYMTPEKLNGYWEAMLPSLTNIAIGLAILFIGMWFAKRVSRVVRKSAVRAPNIDDTLANFLGSIAQYTLTVIVVVAAITKMGMEASSLVAMLGAATLAIGLALQGTLGNVAAGVMLMLFRPYKIGDYVSVAGEEGIVHDVNIFTTVLTSLDNIEIIIV